MTGQQQQPDINKPWMGNEDHEVGIVNSPKDVQSGTCATQDKYVCMTVLETAPGAPKQGPRDYLNLVPWVSKLFFAHTYYAYIYVFYMFLLAFYKAYALQYPDWIRWFEMVLIMVLPIMQHLRFFFGYWGCELGMFVDLQSFIFLCAGVMLVLMYFLFKQAYIIPMDSNILFVAVVLVAAEGVCGAINALQAVKLHTAKWGQIIVTTANIMFFLGTVAVFIGAVMMPREASVVEEVVWESRS